MKKRKIMAIAAIIIAAAMIIACLSVIVLPDLQHATTKASDDAAAAAEAEAEADAEQAKIEEFEAAHSYGRIEEDGAITQYLDKWGISYKEKDGKILVSAERTKKSLYYTNDNSRAKSSVKAGLSKNPISDAPEYVFKLSTEQVNKILTAEKKGYGTKVNFTKDEKKQLKKAVAKTMLQNVVMGLGYTEMVSMQHYGKSKIVYETSTAVAYLVDETEKAYTEADSDGYVAGINRWLYYDKSNGKFYLSQDYLVNIIPVVAQIIEGSKMSIEVAYAEYNWGLDRSDLCQLRRLVLSTEPDTLTAIVFRHYFKDGEVMEEPSVNIRDRRPEIPSTPPTVKTKTPKKDNPAIKKDNPPSGSKKTPPSGSKKTPPSSGQGKKPKPDKDKDKDIKPKDEKEKPEDRPDDKGPGEFEKTPKVPKSPSDKVEDSQYKPQAQPQGGGISTSISDMTPAGTVDNGNGTSTTTTHRISTGGQEVTDKTVTDNSTGKPIERIENAEAETKPIPVRPSEEGTKDGNNNGEFAMPD